MTKPLILIALATTTLASCQSNQQQISNKVLPPPPMAKKIPYNLTEHGDTRVDNYYWMRLSDEQKNAAAESRDQQTKDVLDYLNAENDYTKKVLAHTEEFQKKLFEEMKGRIKEDDQSVPVKDNGYWYYTKYVAGKDYAINCRKKDSMDNPQEEILIDGPAMAAGHDYWALGGIDISDDNQLMCYSEDVVSRRIYNASFKNLSSGQILSDKLEGLAGSPVWAADNKTVFYVKKDPTTLREFQIWRHTLGTVQDKDVLVFQEDNEEFHCFVSRTKSKKYLVIGSHQTLSNEYRVLDASNPNGEFRVIQPRERDLEYSIDHYGDKFYITTNYQAKNFRLMECDENSTTKENWKEVIPHREDVLLEGIEIFKDFLVVDERKNGLTQLRIIKWSDRSEHYMEFQDPAYAAGVGANPDFNTDILRYGYSSMTTPASTYDYNMNTHERTLMKQQEVVGGHNPQDYQSERLYATAKDGTKVPVSLVYKKGTKLDGNAPLLLYAYGSYGATMDAGFSSTRLSLLDRGFVYAIAHIRGGQEMGRHWYEDGKLLKKKNTFTDFIDCADYLVAQKYTSKEKLFAMGGSAGGLLMGAVTNMRPDLWRGVVSAVPFVDVVTTMLDETIPLTTFEFDEWGNPKNKEYYDYMKSYSPYDNIEAKNYPNILVTSGYWDSQVQYWEPAKYVAKLREMKTDQNLLLFWCNMDAGHGGKSGRFEALKEVALEYVFMFDLLGIKE
ncbi:MAG: S9 family peptidase [Flavobacteriales bacterium]|nr:S9 family peptidase [Flavobacteriales bacterium]